MVQVADRTGSEAMGGAEDVSVTAGSQKPVLELHMGVGHGHRSQVGGREPCVQKRLCFCLEDRVGFDLVGLALGVLLTIVGGVVLLLLGFGVLF